MALINKIRQRAGIAIGFVAVAMGFFILGTDLISSNAGAGGGPNTIVGEIAGTEISQVQFQDKLDEIKFNFTQSNGRNPSDTEEASLRNQAWDGLIEDVAFTQQYNELGLQVSDNESIDMVQGKNIHPWVASQFANPQTGAVDRSLVNNFLRSTQNNPQQQAVWVNFENQMNANRLREKYDNLLGKTAYAPSAQAMVQYQAQTASANAKYLYIPFFAVSDSAVSISDSELASYLSSHKDEYKITASRDAKLVKFPIIPSSADTAYYFDEMADLKLDLQDSQDDSTFAAINSEGLTPFLSVKNNALPSALEGNNLSIGETYGPIMENGRLKLFKVADITEDPSGPVARASHILISAVETATNAEKAEAKKEANRILREIKRGASFSEMAREYGSDGTASQGGDLGWFDKQTMVQEFGDAVFNAKRTGLLPSVVQTKFGYHLIDVTATATNTLYKVAVVEREISASDETIDLAFRQADVFAGTTESLSSFEANVTEKSLTSETVSKVNPNDQTVAGMQKARNLVRWMFGDDADIGDVSDVLEIDNNYVVAVMTGAREEGYASLADVKEQVRLKVANQKKGKVIADKLAGMTGSLDEIANAYGSDANVFTASDLKMNTNSLTNVGFSPIAVGKIFALAPGSKTAPFSDESNGVLIAELIGKTEAPEIADYTTYQSQLTSTAGITTPGNVINAMKELAGIKDDRHKFF